jgi:hypothetical protein
MNNLRTAGLCAITFVALLAGGCQDDPKKEPAPTDQGGAKDKPYARKTIETGADGKEIPPGTGGDEVKDVAKPMTIHTGVRFKTVLKHPENAGGLNKETNSYPDLPSQPGPGISLSYSGPCPDPKWLQFVWKTHSYDDKPGQLADGKYRSPPVHDDKGGRTGLPGPESNYITDPNNADPATHLDTADPNSPYYNSEAAHSDDGLTLYDVGKPSPVRDANRGRAETVVYHFSTYMICDGKVAYHVTYTKTFKRKAGEDTFDDGTFGVQSATPNGGLSPSEKADLNGRFSAFPVPTPTP